MPAPTSNDEFLDLVRKSGVADDARLGTYVKQLAAAGQLPPDPGKLAGLMVRDGLLTFFQAEQFLLGKWKRFTIGKYKVLERLGSGGMGQVFLCEHKLMRRRVAVKVLPTAKVDDASSLERFYREARAVAALDHPNIVRAYDIDQEDNLHFLVMEYVDGSSLQDMIKRAGPIDPVRAAHYTAQAAVGLQHAHESGLIHRDIKPGNVLVDRTGTVKILDMGLARFFHDEDDNITKRHDESVLGTADYLAPEQAIDSHGVDIRADIYSLGATMYFMLTGSPPFAEGTVAQKLIWHQTRPPKPLAHYRQDVPEGLVAVLNAMMAKDPAQRYQHPVEVAHALAPWTQSPIAPPTDAEMPTLCLAAQGSQAGGQTAAQTARTLVGRSGPAAARPTSQASIYLTPPGGTGFVPPAPAPPAPPPATPPPAPAPTASNGHGPAFWESVTDAPTTPVATRAPAAVAARPAAPAARPRPRIDLAKYPLAVYAAVGGAAFLLAVLLAFLFGRGTPRDGGDRPGAAAPGEFLVGPGGLANINAALREVAAKGKAGGPFRIVVTGDVTEDYPVLLDGSRMPGVKGLVIEGRGPAPPAVRPSGKVNDASARGFLEAFGVEGLRVANLAFDGQGKFNALVKVQGKCPGLALENLSLTGFKQAGVRAFNCEGEEGRPIRFAGCRVVAPSPASGAAGQVTAVALLTQTTVSSARTNRLIEVVGCRLEGTPDPAARPVGVATDGAQAEVTVADNRFYHCANAVSVRRPGEVIDLTLRSNTFYDCSAGVSWDGLPSDKEASRLVAEKNYFARTKAILGAGSNAGVLPNTKLEGNASDGQSGDGGPVRMKPAAVPYEFTTLDPSKDDFLTYPPDAAPATAPGGPFGFSPAK